ncbi:MAG TPA: DsbE family thiol:disulfide interchange protein [Pyrinomonadaceae bacterium]|nr:DsbE family thiol:disulfide interchange protein [Pyrinomonadaceae bacterium]
MNKYLLIPLVLFIGLVLAIFIVLRRGRDPHEIPSPLINKPAPAFQLPQLNDPSKIVSTTDMRGKVYVLNFWGSWCIACREEHPLLVQYAKSNLVPIIGVDYKYANDNTDERAAAKQFLAELGNPYSVVIHDAEGRTSIDFGVYGAPESFLIDKNGIIRFKQIGPITEDVWNGKIVPMAKQLNQ